MSKDELIAEASVRGLDISDLSKPTGKKNMVDLKKMLIEDDKLREDNPDPEISSQENSNEEKSEGKDGEPVIKEVQEKSVPNVLKDVPKIKCKFCNFFHQKTFDGPGINHEGFQPGGRAEIMFKHLADQELVPFYVPLEPNEAPGSIATCNLNGLRINILKGVFDLKVPVQIREVMMESMQNTAFATQKIMTTSPAASPNYTWKPANARLDLKSEYDQRVLS